jgi:vitamin-K-epoxide reductase (warfarin-sensitive)
MCGLGCTKFFNVVLSLTGLGISAFALWAEMKSEEDGDYSPPCDLGEDISCSVMFNSQYGTGLGLVGKFLGPRHPANQPNNVYAAIFYAFFFFLSLFNYKFIATFQVLLSLCSIAGSAYLGYVLYFLLKNVCVITAANGAVNLFLLTFTMCKRRALIPKPLKEDKFGYYIPTTNYPTNQNNNFKKFI